MSVFILEEYLGDGLYASFDGWHIVLRAPREEGDHWIGIEPAVWEALVKFQKKCGGPAPAQLKDESDAVFNCPKCGSHDWGLNRPHCPHCGFILAGPGDQAPRAGSQ